jgi:cobalt/nickel transport system permease protein
MSHHDAERLDRHAYTDSLIHRLDPRGKVLATLVFIITVVSYPKYAVSPLVPFVLFPMTMAIWGFVPFGLLFRRVLIALPFVVFVGIFNPLLDRLPMLEVGPLVISGGWVSFISLLLRGLLCISSAVVLIATTSMPRIAEALSALGVPSALVAQLQLLYRYLFVLTEEAGRMNRAKQMRSMEKGTPAKVAVGMMSTLLVRTVDRSESIWRAMSARGFEGKLKTPHKMKWRVVDTLFLGAVIVFCLLLRFLPVTQYLGKLGGSL